MAQGTFYDLDAPVTRLVAMRVPDSLLAAAVATFAYRIMLNVKGCEEMIRERDRRCASIRVLLSTDEKPA